MVIMIHLKQKQEQKYIGTNESTHDIKDGIEFRASENKVQSRGKKIRSKGNEDKRDECFIEDDDRHKSCTEKDGSKSKEEITICLRKWKRK